MDEKVGRGNETNPQNPMLAKAVEEYQLSDLIEVAVVKQLLDNYCNSAGIAAAILNLKGDVLIASRWQRICTDFHRINKITCARCHESDTDLALHLNAGENFSLYKCKNGMTDAASPIIIEGRHLGNVFVGQFLLASPDREFFVQQARQFGFDQLAYLNALDEVPIISEDQLPSILGFLSGFSTLVATMGLQKLRAVHHITELAKREGELESEVKARTSELLEAQRIAQLGSWHMDIATNQVSWSEELYKMYGFDPALPPPLYTESMKLFTSESWERLSTAVAQAGEAGIPYELELETVKKDGSRGWMLARGEPVHDVLGAAVGIRGVVMDITERKRAEITMREQTEFLGAIFENLLDAFVLIDFSGIIVDWSSQAEKTFGWIKAEAVGRMLYETIIPIRYREAHIRGMEHFMTSGEGPLLNSLTETFAVHRDGHEFPIELSIVPLKKGGRYEFSAFVRDITERKLNEAINASRLHLVQFSLAHSLDELLEETLNETEKLTGSVIGFYHFVEDDQNSLTLQNWSTRTKAVFCKAEGMGLHYPIDEAGVWVDCVRQAKAVIHNDYASLPNRKGMPEGHATVIRELVVPVFRGKKVSAILGVGNKPTDYTEKDVATVSLLADLAFEVAERKKAEDKINELNRDLEQRVVERTAQLEAANKELETFSYSVSHDLRTPLRAIDGFSHILLNDYAAKLDDEGKRLLNVVKDNTNRMGQLIDDILKFSRTSRLEMTFSEIDMGKLAREVAEELQSSVAGDKVEVEIEPIPSVKGDRAMMRQVFVNLLSNAIKFSHTAETIRIKVGGSSVGGEAVYFVRDNGVGFDMQYADKLFGVFQRLHALSEFEGTGIGLAIVKRVITRHGGRVWADGKVGEGATIYFALPVKETAHG